MIFVRLARNWAGECFCVYALVAISAVLGFHKGIHFWRRGKHILFFLEFSWRAEPGVNVTNQHSVIMCFLTTLMFLPFSGVFLQLIFLMPLQVVTISKCKEQTFLNQEKKVLQIVQSCSDSELHCQPRYHLPAKKALRHPETMWRVLHNFFYHYFCKRKFPAVYRFWQA